MEWNELILSVFEKKLLKNQRNKEENTKKNIKRHLMEKYSNAKHRTAHRWFCSEFAYFARFSTSGSKRIEKVFGMSFDDYKK